MGRNCHLTSSIVFGVHFQMTFFEIWGESGCQKGTENGSRHEVLNQPDRYFSFIVDKRHSEDAAGPKNTLRRHNLDILLGLGGYSALILAHCWNLFPSVLSVSFLHTFCMYLSFCCPFWHRFRNLLALICEGSATLWAKEASKTK